MSSLRFFTGNTFRLKMLGVHLAATVSILHDLLELCKNKIYLNLKSNTASLAASMMHLRKFSNFTRYGWHYSSPRIAMSSIAILTTPSSRHSSHCG